MCDKSWFSQITLLHLHGVLLVPQMAKNLVSLQMLITQHSLKLECDKTGCVFSDITAGVTPALQGIVHNGLYKLQVSEVVSSAQPVHVDTSTIAADMYLWHCRLGHLNHHRLISLSSSTLFRTPLKFKTDKSLFCEACIHGILHKAPHPSVEPTRATTLLEVVHKDICGPMSTMSLGGASYFLSFIDDWSRYIVLYFLVLIS